MCAEGVEGSGEGGAGKGEGIDECVRETQISSPPPTCRPHNILEFLRGAAFETEQEIWSVADVRV